MSTPIAAMLVLLALSGHAHAQSTEAQLPASEPPPREPEPEETPEDPTSLDVRGRVFVRNILSRPSSGDALDSPGWSSRLTLDSARLGARYRDRDLHLRIEVEAELAGDEAEVRDAHIRLEPRPWLRVQAGRFKQPMSAVALTSRWDLPIVERGLIDDFAHSNELTAEPDVLPLGSRRNGVQAQLRLEDPWEPRLTVGVFRSRVHDQLAEALGTNRVPLSLSQGFPEDIYGRLEIEPADDVHVGLSLAWVGMLGTAGTRDTFEHGFVAGLDLVLETDPIRLWLEGFMGDSPVHFGTALVAQGQFAAARAILATRLHVLPELLQYLEPYTMAQYVNASSDVQQDSAFEISGGLNLGVTEMWRIQLAAYHRAMDERLLGAGTRLIIQLGAVF